MAKPSLMQGLSAGDDTDAGQPEEGADSKAAFDELYKRFQAGGEDKMDAFRGMMACCEACEDPEDSGPKSKPSLMIHLGGK